MGLRDRLKQTAKAILGRPEPARADARPEPAPVTTPSAAPVTTPSASTATPAAKPAAPSQPAKPAAKPAATRSGLPAEVTPDGYRAVATSGRVTTEKPGTFPIGGGTIVAIFRYGGALYAIDNACAHEDGPVGEGAVSGKCVQCPYHDWEYDFTTGACHTDPERSLATYAVRERDGFIWVGPRLTEGTGARGGDHNDGLETITR